VPRHPPVDLLLAVASGAADLAHRVLIEGHLATCAGCRRELSGLARPGGLIFAGVAGGADIVEETVPADAWRRLAERVQSEPRSRFSRFSSPGEEPDGLAGIPLPEAARRELPDTVRQRPPRWRSAWAPGARWAVLWKGGRGEERGEQGKRGDVRSAGGGALVLGRLGPGRGFPRHGHPGREDVLVLAGGYADHLGVYEAGDYAVYQVGSAHGPVTEHGEECWVLTRLELPIRFTGWRGWLQRLLAAAEA
jgi:putative transcriptional regulator